MEAEIFIAALFRRHRAADAHLAGGDADVPPRVRWNPVSRGCDLERFMLRARETARVEPSTVPADS